MKPFNLEAALRGERVILEDGRKVTDLKYFPSADGDYCLAGVVDGHLMTWCRDGSYTPINVAEEKLGLIMKPTTRNLTWYVADAEGYLYTSASDRVNNLKKILSAIVNEDGSVTVEVEE